MDKKIYAIRDRIANDLAGYYPLIVFRTDAQAVRYFTDSLTADKSALAAHPDDYELIMCGTVEDDGNIHSTPPTIIITGASMRAMMEQQPKEETK